MLLALNKIVADGQFFKVKYEIYHDQNIESVISHPNIVDVIVNFGPKKYLLVPKNNSYMLYLILRVQQQKNTQINVKPMKYVMDYLLKNLS